MKKTAEEFHCILSNLQCDDCDHGFDCPEKNNQSVSRTKPSSKNNLRRNLLKYSHSGDWPILGPDQVTVDQCIEFAKGLAKHARDLIIFVPRKETRFLLKHLIDSLEDEAERCCYAGGIWKGCLQKLANKFHLWNEKWNLFRIPPDPAWD